MQKAYSRINWENEPSTKTPLSEANLNHIDYAVNTIDDRVVDLYGYEERTADSEKAAAGSAKLAESWAHGGTGARDGEDDDNSKHWAEEAKKSEDAVKEAIDTNGYAKLYILKADGHLYMYRTEAAAKRLSFAIKDHKNLEVSLA